VARLKELIASSKYKIDRVEFKKLLDEFYFSQLPGVADLKEEGSGGLGQADILQSERIIGITQKQHCPWIQLIREKELREQPPCFRLHRENVSILIAGNIPVLNYGPDESFDVKVVD